MIKKSLILFLILITINIIIRDIYKPDIITSQSQWQDNQISAQTFLYSNTDSIENIITGSSMAFWIATDSLNNFYNLAMGGESAKDGLEIIKRKGVYPKRVFIETNVILKQGHTELFDILYNPVMHPLREKTSIFRDGKQPLPLVSSLLNSQVIEHIIPYNIPFFKISKNKETQNKIKLPETENTPQRNNLEAIEYKVPETVIRELQEYISDLEQHNTEIIFFEMPTENIDCNSDVAPLYRTTTEKLFPPGKYTYIPSPKCGSYQTSDGVHLLRSEALRYTRYFREQVDSLIHIGK